LRIQRLLSRQTELSAERALILDAIEESEATTFEARSSIAREVTAQIDGHVVVIVDHLADTTQFRSFLTDSLYRTKTRGTIIDQVSEQVLPRQLLEMVEQQDASGLTALTGIAADKLEKLLSFLDDEDILAGLAEVTLADSVDFRLRDGAVDKSVDELSTGQKCAVTLPIVLSEQTRALILDQPEDHLDNAYLVQHVVQGMMRRGSGGAQTIVATHNANIPVLGSAEKVLVLESDGTNGSVRTQGSFDAPEVVDAITRLMEGGRDAFRARSTFYAEHGTHE